MLKVLSVLGGIALVATQAQVVTTPDVPAVDRVDTCQRMFHWIGADGIRFHASSATLRGSSFAVLERLAEFAHDCTDMRIGITGHTDDLGSPEFNQRLSEQRASAVAAFLASRGVSNERLVVRGAGASRPVADNRTASGRERNRRIDIEMLSPMETPAPAGL